MSASPDHLHAAETELAQAFEHLHRRNNDTGQSDPHLREAVAELWACLYPNPDSVCGGDVYRVEPEGDVEPDPDWRGEPGVSVAAPRARIVGIARTGVRRNQAARLVAEFG